MINNKKQNVLWRRPLSVFNGRAFGSMLVGAVLTLSGVILDLRSAYASNPGDIAIVGVRADDIDATSGNGNDEGIAWVPLINLAPNAEIFFTDSGWTATNTFRASEGVIKYTAPSGGLTAGTVMLMEFTRVSGKG